MTLGFGEEKWANGILAVLSITKRLCSRYLIRFSAFQALPPSFSAGWSASCGGCILPGASPRVGCIEMRWIVDGLNWLSDQDWGWWPMLKYRPRKDELISNRLVLKLTPMFGTLSGLTIAFVAGHILSVRYLVVDIAVGWIAYFALYRAIFVPAWNSRASSIKSAND